MLKTKKKWSFFFPGSLYHEIVNYIRILEGPGLIAAKKKRAWII